MDTQSQENEDNNLQADMPTSHEGSMTTPTNTSGYSLELDGEDGKDKGSKPLLLKISLIGLLVFVIFKLLPTYIGYMALSTFSPVLLIIMAYGAPVFFALSLIAAYFLLKRANVASAFGVALLALIIISSAGPPISALAVHSILSDGGKLPIQAAVYYGIIIPLPIYMVLCVLALLFSTWLFHLQNKKVKIYTIITLLLVCAMIYVFTQIYPLR